MKTLPIIVLGGVLTVFSHTTRAQEIFGPAQQDWEFTLSGTGSSANDFEAGAFGAGFGLGYYLTDHWEAILRQGLTYSDFGESSWNGSTRFALDYNFDLDRWRPFLGANVGGLYGDGVEETLAAGLEGGVKYYVKPKTFLFGSIEYQWLFDKPNRANNTFDDGQFIYGVGIGFNF